MSILVDCSWIPRKIQPIESKFDGCSPSRVPAVSFDADPASYRHWTLDIQGDVAYLRLDVEEPGGLVPGYELKMNSYDLGVDIELYDATQRLRFSHPGVRGRGHQRQDRNFCAGANIRMLAQSSHSWKVNFCTFTNETRNGMEDATAHSGQTYLAAGNGTAAGGGYELALACETILLVDDNSAAVALPEVSLLGVLPGTGGLTRVIDKRRVRKDRADVFARPEGIRGRQAVEWRLVDEVIPKRAWDSTVAERAAAAAARLSRPTDARGVAPPAAPAGVHRRHQLPPRRGSVRPRAAPGGDHDPRTVGRGARVAGARSRARRRLLAAGHDPRARRPHPAAAGQ